MKHRDAALKQLAALLTAELLIAKLFYGSGISLAIVILTFSFLAIVSVVFAHSGVLSCRRAFLAGMENALLANKVVWAMGLGGKVVIGPVGVVPQNMPVRDDATLYVPRYLRDSSKFLTTEEFTEYHLGKAADRKHRNTYYWAKVTIWTLGVAGVITGVICAVTICGP